MNFGLIEKTLPATRVIHILLKIMGIASYECNTLPIGVDQCQRIVCPTVVGGITYFKM